MGHSPVGKFVQFQSLLTTYYKQWSSFREVSNYFDASCHNVTFIHISLLRAQSKHHWRQWECVYANSNVCWLGYWVNTLPLLITNEKCSLKHSPFINSQKAAKASGWNGNMAPFVCHWFKWDSHMWCVHILAIWQIVNGFYEINWSQSSF